MEDGLDGHRAHMGSREIIAVGGGVEEEASSPTLAPSRPLGVPLRLRPLHFSLGFPSVLTQARGSGDEDPSDSVLDANAGT